MSSTVATSSNPAPGAPSASSSVASGITTAANVQFTSRPSVGIASVFKHGWQIDLAGVAFCAVLSVGAYFAGWQPMESNRLAEEARHSALALSREQVSALSLSARAVRTQLNNAQAAINKIDVPLQPAATVNQRMAELTSLAGECGLDVQYTQTGAIVSSARYGQLPIQLSGAGTYRTCAGFLHRLRERFPDMSVRSFDIAASPSQSSTVTSFNFQLAWYVQPANGAR